MTVVGSPGFSSGSSETGMVRVWVRRVVLNMIDTEPVTSNRFSIVGSPTDTPAAMVRLPATPKSPPTRSVRTNRTPVADP